MIETATMTAMTRLSCHEVQREADLQALVDSGRGESLSDKAGFPSSRYEGLGCASGGRLSAGSLRAVMMMHRLALLRL
jgi:hypothetical protein